MDVCCATCGSVLVREGYAVVSTFPADVKNQARFLDAERAAREANRGLWAECGSADVPVPGGAPPPPVAPVQPGGDCDPSDPDVCIPPYRPDLNCGDISQRRFRVVEPDLHRFDGDNDGIGCESG